MRFFHRNRRLLSFFTIALIAISSSATTASAYYNPKTGRFLSADPNGQGLVVAPGLPRVELRHFMELWYP